MSGYIRADEVAAVLGKIDELFRQLDVVDATEDTPQIHNTDGAIFETHPNGLLITPFPEDETTGSGPRIKIVVRRPFVILDQGTARALISALREFTDGGN